MVNVRKIGAIATGALFLGATFGMASAVTVPSAFTSSMLSSGGVAKAQLVVGGSGADGKIADTQSAEIIQAAVAANLAGTVGGDITINFASNELHDDSTAEDDFGQTTLGGSTGDQFPNRQVSLLNSTAVLRFDGDDDTDLSSDPEDYDLYTHVVVINENNGDIQFALSLNSTRDSTYSNSTTNSELLAGEVVKIKGNKYVITDNETSDSNIKMGPALYKTLTADTVDKDKASTITGTKALLYGIDGTLRFYNDGSQEDVFNLAAVPFTPWKLNSSVITSEHFTPYNIYIVGNSSNMTGISGSSIKVTMTEKGEEFTLTNDQAGAMGYSSIKIVDANWFTGGDTGIFFLSDPITLVTDDTIDLPDTYYQIKYTSSGKFDLKRKKMIEVASGTKLQTNVDSNDDWLNDTITMSVVGADVSINFASNELHDDSTAADDFTQATLGGTEFPNRQVSPLNSTAVLRFDGDDDTDLSSDPEDYDLYTHMVVINENNGDIQFALSLNSTEDSTYSSNPDDSLLKAGDVVNIKGSKYVITDNETSDSNIKMGPALYKTLTADTVDKDKASTITGKKALLYGIDGTLRFYNDGSQEDVFNLAAVPFTPWKLNSSVITSEHFTPYNIYIVGNSSAMTGVSGSSIKVTMTEKGEEFTLTNDQAGAMGYSSIKIVDANWFTGGDTGIFFLSDPITLVTDDNIEIPDTYYEVKYTSSGKFDLKRRKTATVASGTKLQTNTEPGIDFLDDTITVTTTGGEVQTEGPTLDIVDLDEGTADESKNLVLIGGPVANTMTAELVQNTKSETVWETSDGDIEVIPSAFTSGKYGIIVAGKERAQTKAAADALAAEIA